MRRRILWVCLALIAANVLVYAPVRQHDFVNFDDPQYVTENPQVRSGMTWRGVWWALTTGHFANWHPLTWLSHMLDVQLFGVNPGPHHVTSALLHTLNGLLLFGLHLRMTGALGQSALVAALFALHPLHVESVAWVADRKDVLSTLFGMLAIWGYLEYVRQPRLGRYLLVIVFFALALTAKPMLVTLPFVLLLLDFWPLGRLSLAVTADGGDSASNRQRSVRFLILEKLPLILLALPASIVTYVVQQQGGGVKSLAELPLEHRVSNALVAYPAYIGKMLWPWHLAAVYPHRSISGWLVVSATVGLIAVSWVVLRNARRHPYLPVGWLWYLGTLVPVIGVIQGGGHAMADRYTYVPLIGLFVMLAWGIPQLVGRWPYRDRLLAALAGIAVLACGITAGMQVRHWKTSIALWEHALRVTSDNYRAHHNLAHALARQGQVNDAIAHYSAALRIKPDFAESHHNLGRILAGQGRVDEAVAHYSEALRIEPNYEEAHTNFGVALAGLGRTEEAIRHFSEALKIKPGLPEARNNLGVALASLGRLDEATREFSAALEIKPDYTDAHKNLGLALSGQGRKDDAIRHFSEALRSRPEDPDLHYELGVLFAAKGHAAEAVRSLETALDLKPSHEAARDALATLRRRPYPISPTRPPQ